MKAEERKQALVFAAVSCFARNGYHTTQVSDIIDEANVARGTFYLYFKSKHEIFEFILDDYLTYLRSQIRSIDLTSDESPAIQMKQNVVRVIDAVLEKPEIGKIIFNEAVGLDESIHAKLKNFYKVIITSTTNSIQKGMSFGLLNTVDPELAACVALGSIREIITQRDIFQNVKVNRDSIVDGLISIIFGGMGSKLIPK